MARIRRTSPFKDSIANTTEGNWNLEKQKSVEETVKM